MKFIEIDRYHESKSIYAITIFKFRIDLRPWYQLWINKGEDSFDEEHVGWSNVWLNWSELQDELWYDKVEPDEPNDLWKSVKRKTPRDWKYRKIPLIITICSWSSLWYKYKRLLAGILIGFLLSLLIQL